LWQSYLITVINEGDPKNAALVQRKIIMGGCNHQWIHGVRQIISFLESKNVTESATE
jgi:hypothetical protein